MNGLNVADILLHCTCLAASGQYYHLECRLLEHGLLLPSHLESSPLRLVVDLTITSTP